MAPIPDLPTELVAQVFDHLWNDIGSLQQASLVCSRFRSVCQEILFSDLYLGPPRYTVRGDDPSPGDRLLQAFKQNPTLGTYVKSVVIVEDPMGAPYNMETWLTKDAALPTALAMVPFHKVREFTLCRGGHTRWVHLSTALRNAVLGLCSSPSLVSLALARVSVNLLGVCGRHLRHLELDNVENGPDVSPSALGPSRIKLDTLRFRNHRNLGEIVDYLLDDSKVVISNLKKLYVYMGPAYAKDGAEINRLLFACASSLEVFTLEPSTDIGGPAIQHNPYLIDLSQLTHLRRLSVCCFASYFNFGAVYGDPLPWVLKLFQSVQPTNVVEKIVLHVNHDVGDNNVVEPQPWISIGSLFRDKRRFPKLVHVDIVLHSYLLTSSPSLDDLADNVRGYLVKDQGCDGVQLRVTADLDGIFTPFQDSVFEHADYIPTT